MKTFIPPLLLLILSACSNPKVKDYTPAKRSIRLFLSKRMNDYSSYQPVDFIFDTSARYKPGVKVHHTYREKNLLGAIILSDYYFYLDSNWKVIDVKGYLEGVEFDDHVN